MDAVFNAYGKKELRRKLRKDSTGAEIALWNRIRNGRLLGFKFRRQRGIENFVVDFYCPEAQLAIEIDGDSHFIDNATTRKDIERQRKIESHGIKFLRFTNTDVFRNIDSVLNKIIDYFPLSLLEEEGKDAHDRN